MLPRGRGKRACPDDEAGGGGGKGAGRHGWVGNEASPEEGGGAHGSRAWTLELQVLPRALARVSLDRPAQLSGHGGF